MQDAESHALHARTRALVAAFAETGALVPDGGAAAFDALARDLARFQARRNPGYARLLAARGLTPDDVRVAADAPAVPTDAFKATRVATFPAEQATHVFRTSGTTVGRRGEHALRDVATYDAAALAFGRACLVADLGARTPRVLVLGPSLAVAPDSSLGHMCAAFVERLGSPAGAEGSFFLDADGVFDVAGLDEAVARATVEERPVLLLATSFALVHFFDLLGEDPFPLPEGSRVMQTGGTKGKSREVSADELRRRAAEVFRVRERAVVSEYGMTELGSQFYERTLVEPDAKPGVLAPPPWARVTAVDPETLAPLPEGEVGLARVVDLVNVDGAAFVQTQDRVRVLPGSGGRFELLGRLPGAPPRGCSIAVDELVGGASA